MRSTQHRFRFGTHPYTPMRVRTRQVLDIIRERLKATGVSPSIEEIRRATGASSKSHIHRAIGVLVADGKLRRIPKRARALEVVEGLPTDYPQRPLLDTRVGYRFYRVVKVSPEDDAKLIEMIPHDQGGPDPGPRSRG